MEGSVFPIKMQLWHLSWLNSIQRILFPLKKVHIGWFLCAFHLYLPLVWKSKTFLEVQLELLLQQGLPELLVQQGLAEQLLQQVLQELLVISMPLLSYSKKLVVSYQDILLAFMLWSKQWSVPMGSAEMEYVNVTVDGQETPAAIPILLVNRKSSLYGLPLQLQAASWLLFPWLPLPVQATRILHWDP